jgi:hypothetical protein
VILAYLPTSEQSFALHGVKLDGPAAESAQSRMAQGRNRQKARKGRTDFCRWEGFTLLWLRWAFIVLNVVYCVTAVTWSRHTQFSRFGKLACASVWIWQLIGHASRQQHAAHYNPL